jgi:hypothetical protein
MLKLPCYGCHGVFVMAVAKLLEGAHASTILFRQRTSSKSH